MNKLFGSRNFWLLHLTGWATYCIFSIAINTVYRFPVVLILIETLFFFIITTVFYLAVIFLSRTRWHKVYHRLVNRLDYMLVVCTLLGAVVGIIWTYLMLTYLFNHFITPDHYVPHVSERLLHRRYYWGRLNDAIFLFCIWGLCWVSSHHIKNDESRKIVEKYFHRSVCLVLLLLGMNIFGGMLVFYIEKVLVYVAFELVSQILLTIISVIFINNLLFHRGNTNQSTSLLQSYSLVLILLIPLSMLNIVFLDYWCSLLRYYLNQDGAFIRRYSLEGVSLVDLIRRISGAARQFFHGAFLLSAVCIYFKYYRQSVVHIQALDVFPRDWRFWINNIFSWFFLGLILLLIEYWKYSDAVILARTYSVAKIIFIGSFLSLVARFFILRYKWNLLNPYQLVPRLSVIAIMMGSLQIFLDLYTDALLQVLYFGHKSYEFIYAGANDNVIQQSVFTKSILFILWFFLWSFVYSFFVSNQQKLELTISKLKLQKENQESQLSLLNNQLDPHFIFNTLTGIRYLILQNPDLARDSVMKLSELLRKNLGKQQFNKVTLKEEMVLVKDYLDLYRLQLEDRLTWSEDIQEEALYCLIPPMIIQMLVENALKHGLSLAMNPGYINLTVKINNNQLLLAIENSIDLQENKKIPSNGIGIDNIKKRLKLIYDESAIFNMVVLQYKAQVNIIFPKEISNESVGY